MMIFECDTYKDVLILELERRVNDNPLFSANAFAKKLGISQSYLSLILNGKHKLNEKSADLIANNLNFTSLEKEFFLLLTKREAAASDDVYELHHEKIQELRKKNNVEFLDIEKFHVIADWHYSAILECINLTTAEHSPEAYAKKLQLDTRVVVEALTRLERLGLVARVGGKFTRADAGFLTTAHEIKSAGLKKFHSQILKMASDALENQNIEERNISGITIALDPLKLPEAKRRVQKFMEELMEFLEDGDRSEVYQLSTQLFKLTAPSKEK